MTPSATHHRRSPRGIRAHLRRRHNAATARTPPLAGATARALAAGLWRLRHAERQAVNPGPLRHDAHSPRSPRHRRKGKAKLCNGNKTRCGLGVGIPCRNHSILDKIDACAVDLPYGCWMEKATKWDQQHACLHNMLASHDPCQLPPHVHHARAMPAHGHASAVAVALEAELDKARARISELEDEKRVMRKKVERFLRKVTEEKASWKSRMRDKAQHVIATSKEDVKTERRHRRQLEAANGKLVKELAEAKASAKQAVQSYEMERKAREMMEDACEELTKEVEEDQAEVELLRRECLGMREEMEEERRMLQMAEVWREERVQMKLSDAKLALEHKYSQLNRLQAEMESFLRKDGKSIDANNSTLREARMISEAASSVRLRGVKELSHRNPHAPEDVDRVFQHFCRREETASGGSPASNVHSVSPATDIFLEKLDGSAGLENGSGSSWDTPDRERRRDSCASAGTSDRSVARASNASLLSNGKGGSGLTDQVHHPSPSRGATATGKNTALIRRLWRSAISESRKKTAGSAGTTPTSEQQRSTVITPALPVGEQCSSSYLVKPQQQRQRSHESKGLARGPHKHKQKQSLQEKLLEARMDDRKPLPSSAAKHKMQVAACN
ncbi:uncharacterized protein LOC119354653 [Triticum dicoccoides]|uniref:uncharacterized protein LOC119354653 n=1 Tax=Triticum dicoccoides TaxID=85692 RepID=UPI00189099CB|nr:uncharacterized protein LOC119354653 [Triticum dicoccoides]